MTVEQIEYELSGLSEKINLIDNNVKFNIQILWGVLALIVAVLGMAIYFLVKQYIKTTLDLQLKEQINIVKKGIIEDLQKEEFILELPRNPSWKLIQPIVMHKYKEGYIQITGSIIFDGEKEGRYNTISVIPYGLRPLEETKFFVMNGELNGECVILKDGSIVFKKGNIDNIVQFNVIYKQEDIK